MNTDKIFIKMTGLQYVGKSTRRRQACVVACPTCTTQRTILVKNYEACKTTKCNTCKHITHGEANSPLYKVYGAIKQRCNNQSNPNYQYYGGRGITICSEWLSFIVFKEWAMQNGYKNELTIDRRDNDGDYEPANCRWVDRHIQARNTRVICSNNTSGYRGVVLDKRTNKWYTRVKVSNKSINLGTFSTKEEPAKAFNNYVISNNLEHTLNKI